MHLAPLIKDLAVILALAAAVALLFRQIRQPLVLGYVIAGMLVGPRVTSLKIISDIPNIRVWADLGVIFLMFTLGLDFSFRRLARVGISSFLTACLEVGGMMLLGYTAGRLLGWTPTNSIFLACLVSISSTTIIFKTLDELNLRTRRFSERIVSILVVEDLIAILMLAALSTLATSEAFNGLAVLASAGKLLFVVGAWFLVGYFWVPQFVKYVGKVGNDEMLTILSLGLCLSLVVVAAKFDYSLALGAFIMGSILAESTESLRIEELMKPLRDLFAAIFFVSVGLLVNPRIFVTEWKLILALTLVVLCGKILLVTLSSLLTGQTLRTAIQVGFGMAQIGEFSYILAGLGVTLKISNEKVYPVVVAVSLLTTLTTPPLIRRSHKIGVALEAKLPLGIKSFIANYSAWSQQRSADLRRRTELYRALLKWILNGIAVSVIFILVSEVSRQVDDYLPAVTLSMGLRWLIAIVLSAPFLWGMSNVFQGLDFSHEEEGSPFPKGGTLFLARVFSVLCIGGLSTMFFDPTPALLATSATLLLVFLLFYRQLEQSYRWFESQFLSAFKTAPKSRKNVNLLKHLAPWDAHLIRIKVHPNSDFVGKSLGSTRLRSDFGVNVVVIQRGIRSLIAPHPEETIFPKDELLVLGTDEQVERVRPLLENPHGLTERFQSLSRYELTPVVVDETSPLRGKRIRDSGIREICRGMVVGVERGERRMINPDSDLILLLGDTLYVVGETQDIKRLTTYLAQN